MREPVTAIAISADPTSVFTGGEIGLSVTLWAGTEAGRALGGVVIDLDDGDAGGTFTPAIITIGDSAHEGTATYTNSAASMVTITATSGEMTDTADVEIKSTIRDLSVNGETEMAIVVQGSTITVRAIGPVGGGTVRILDSDGEKVGITSGLDPKGEPDPDGDQIYSRSHDLPEVLADGIYTIVVEIDGEENKSLSIQVLSDQAPPTLSDANVLPTTVANGALLTLTVKATASSESNPIVTVTADVSAVDSTKTDMVELTAQPGTDNTYFAIHPIASIGNTNEDGPAEVSFTATDQIGGKGTASASVTLANDVTVIESVNVPSDLFRPGDTVTITATGTPGGTASFDVATDAHDVKLGGKAMKEDPDGTYTGSFEVVRDIFPEGTYYVTVNLNTKSTSTTGLNIGPAGYMFTLTIPKGTHIIHIPLGVKQINGEDASIDTVGDVYDALGDAVNYIITVGDDGGWKTYIGDMSAGTAADAAIGDDSGLVAVMGDAMTLELVGEALGTAGSSQINIDVGNNLVGVPLDPVVDMMISAALVEGVSSISVSNAAGNGFHTIREPGDDGDGPVVGGVGYLVSYIGAEAASIPIFGSAWENEGAVSAAPAVAFDGSQTPVLYVEGGVMDEFDMLSRVPELRVTVKNLSTGASLDTVLGTEQSATAYSGTFVELSRHAAKAGDVLEIVAHSPNPYVSVFDRFSRLLLARKRC